MMQIKENYPEVSSPICLRVESLKEILADKITALILRDYIKYRDFWDIKFLKDQLIPTDYNLIRQKLQDYHCQNIETSLDKKYKMLQEADLKNDFNKEMVRFLAKDMFEWVEEVGFFKDIAKIVFEEFSKVSKEICNKNYDFANFSMEQPNSKKLHKKDKK